MPLAAPQGLGDIIEKLNECYMSGKRLGDIDRSIIVSRLNEAKAAQPDHAFMGLGILSAFEKNEKEMRHNFKNAIQYGPNDPDIYFNYGVSLLKTGFPEEAAQAFEKTLSFGSEAKHLLNDLAFNVMSLRKPELELEVLDMAARLQCDGEHIRLLGLYIGCANANSETEVAELLEKSLTPEYLKKHSAPISEGKWQKMKKLAAELERHI